MNVHWLVCVDCLEKMPSIDQAYMHSCPLEGDLTHFFMPALMTENELTLLLQSIGPDEYPEGYYRHLAMEYRRPFLAGAEA